MSSLSLSPRQRAMKAIPKVCAATAATAALAGLTVIPAYAADFYIEDQHFDDVVETIVPLNGATGEKMEIFYDDGTDHYNDYPEQLRQALTLHGKDYRFETKDGKVVNASWTYYQAVVRYHTLLESTPEGTNLELLKWARPFYQDSWTIKPVQHGPFGTSAVPSRFDFTFLESARTGDISLVDDGGYFGDYYFQPGDTIHSFRRYNFQAPQDANYGSTTVGYSFNLFRSELVPTSEGKSEWKEASNWKVIPATKVYLDGTAMTDYQGPASLTQDGKKVNAKEFTVWKNGDDVDHLIYYTADIPQGPYLSVGTTEQQSTVGGGNSAGVVSSRQSYFRLPEVEIHDVWDKDYRQKEGYEADAAFEERIVHNTGRSYADADYKTRIEHTFTPLELEQLAGTDLFKNRNFRPVYTTAEDAAKLARIKDPRAPYYGVSPTEQEWQEIAAKTLPGLVFVDTDLPKQRRLYFNHATNPDAPEIKLRQHYYRTYRQRPSAVNLLKKDADSGAPLAGAQFKIYGEDGKACGSEKVFVTDASGAINFYSPAQPAAALSDAYVRSLPAADDCGIISTDNGMLFEPGRYVFKEIAAPEGYELPENAATVFTVPQRPEESSTAQVALTVTNQLKPTPSQTTTPETTTPTTPETTTTEPFEPDKGTEDPSPEPSTSTPEPSTSTPEEPGESPAPSTSATVPPAPTTEPATPESGTSSTTPTRPVEPEPSTTTPRPEEPTPSTPAPVPPLPLIPVDPPTFEVPSIPVAPEPEPPAPGTALPPLPLSSEPAEPPAAVLASPHQGEESAQTRSLANTGTNSLALWVLGAAFVLGGAILTSRKKKA